MSGAKTPMMSLAEAAVLLPGAVLVGDGATVIDRVHSDTRSVTVGDLFVALKGERFDAHDFLTQAKAEGAVAAMAQHGLAEAGLPGLLVADTLAALQTLAGAWRARHALALIAVTGSNGKTTVTQMLAAILRAWQGDAALATAGNFNNHIGLPLTLLRLRPQHRAAVVELGMNHAGEIAQLAALAQPTVALVNNAQREHQEFMASVQAVAWENGAAISALSPCQACRMAATICVTVVLPLLPVMAASGRCMRWRHAAARSCSACRLSSTSRPGSWPASPAAAPIPRSASAAAAPAARACGR